MTLLDFVERKQLLSTLEADVSWKQWAPRDPTKVILIHGRGGMGKTSSALAFANKHRLDFSLIQFFHYDDETLLYQEYENLAQRFCKDLKPGMTLQQLKGKVHSYLENDFKQSWLLILDNVENKLTNKDLPHQGGHIIITSQDQFVWDGKTHSYSLSAFTKEEAVQLLSEVTKEEESEEMHLLAEEIGYFPFAVHQVARYIAEVPGMTIGNYRTTYDLKQQALEADVSPHADYDRVFKTVWNPAMGHVKQTHPLAAEWLNVCAYLHPDQISQEILEAWIKEKAPESNCQALAFQIKRALNQFDLIQESSDHQHFSLHRLFQQSLIYNQKDQQERVYQEVFDFLLTKWEAIPWQEPETWGKAKSYLPHLMNMTTNKSFEHSISQEKQRRFFQKFMALFRLLKMILTSPYLMQNWV